MRYKKNILVCYLIISCFLLNGCGQSKSPNEADIKDAIQEYNMMEFSQGGLSNLSGETIIMNNIDAVHINRQQTEEKSNITYCTIEMSNDNCRVVMDCNLNFSYYDDKKWYPEGQEIESFVFYPLSGVDEEQAYNITVEKLHAEPETIWGGWGLGEQAYSHDSVYKLQLKEHETDLDNNIDKLIYDYFKSSDFCTESGLVEMYYTFNSGNGNWEYNDILDDGITCEYHPEGQWRFDCYTHFYRINISNIDYINNTALIYYKDSSSSIEADSGELINYVQVNFTITDEGMYFNPFHNVIHGVYTYEHDVYLLLKKDTMYISIDGSNYLPSLPRYSPMATIKYDANGGYGAPEDLSVRIVDGVASYILTEHRPSRDGYNFIGWRLENSSAYDIDNPGQSITIEVPESCILTYYAQWN